MFLISVGLNALTKCGDKVQSELNVHFILFQLIGNFTSLGKFASNQSIFFRKDECLGITKDAASPSS